MNDKIKNEALKQVVAYKQKYADYKAKTKSANSQITRLS